MDLLADGSNSVRSFKGFSFFLSFLSLNTEEFCLNTVYVIFLIHIPEFVLQAFYLIQTIKI